MVWYIFPPTPATPWIKNKPLFVLSLEVTGLFVRAADLSYSSTVCCHLSLGSKEILSLLQGKSSAPRAAIGRAVLAYGTTTEDTTGWALPNQGEGRGKSYPLNWSSPALGSKMIWRRKGLESLPALGQSRAEHSQGPGGHSHPLGPGGQGREAREKRSPRQMPPSAACLDMQVSEFSIPGACSPARVSGEDEEV